MYVDNAAAPFVHLLRDAYTVGRPLPAHPRPCPGSCRRLHAGSGRHRDRLIVSVTSSAEGALLALEDRRGDEVSRGITDRFGSYIFTEVKPGPGYVVRNLADGSSQSVTVLDFKDHPAQSFYKGQTLKEGYNYRFFRLQCG